LYFAAIPLVAAAFVMALWLIVRRRGGVSDDSCGRCGYLVVGLTGSICPECGGDLFQVGVRRPGDVKPMSRFLRGLIFTLLYIATIPIVFPLIAPMLPRWYSGASSLEMSSPISQNYYSLTAIASGAGWSPVVKFDHVDLTLVPKRGDARSLRIDIRPNDSEPTIDLTNDDDQTITVHDIRDVTPPVVLAWMKLFAGPDSTQLRDEAESVSVETIKLASSELQVQEGYIHHTPFGGLNFRQWPTAPVMSWRVIVPLIAAALLIWIIGLALVLRPRKPARPEVTHA
jgi:hypothetical protein